MKRVGLVLAALFLALLISGFAFGHMSGYNSQRGYGHMGMMGHGMMRGNGMMGYSMMNGAEDCPMLGDHMLSAEYYLQYDEELSLSKSQIRELKNIRNDVQKEFIEERAELDKLSIEFDDVINEENADLAKIKSLNKKIASLQADLRFKNIEAGIKATGVLNKEQLGKLESSDSEWHCMDGQHGSHMMH